MIKTFYFEKLWQPHFSITLAAFGLNFLSISDSKQTPLFPNIRVLLTVS